MQKLLRFKHELWLKILFGALALPKGEAQDVLLDFANIEYRHMKWLACEMKEVGRSFDWERENIEFSFDSSFELFVRLIDTIEDIQMYYGDGALYDRMKNDENFMLYKLRMFQKEYRIDLHSFDRHLTYKNLDQDSLKALVQFLFEEIYKEYELILVYTYSQIHTDNATLSLIFEDLIYESLYHLKSFGILAARLGILNIPRPVMKEVYLFTDMKEFLRKGIDEELAAKEQCRALSRAIKDEELSLFFDFINSQEDYHIELMKKALKQFA